MSVVIIVMFLIVNRIFVSGPDGVMVIRGSWTPLWDRLHSVLGLRSPWIRPGSPGDLMVLAVLIDFLMVQEDFMIECDVFEGLST